MKYAALVSLALAVVATQARAQTSDERLRGQVDTPTYASLHNVFDSARAAGLPPEPLVDKALEGVAKHADGDRIVAVVRDMETRLAAARTALGGYGTADELSAGTAALRAGISPATLAELRRVRHNEQVTIPLAVAAELVARGVRPDSASAEVLRLAAAGARDVELAALPRSVAAPSMATSASPGAATPGASALVTDKPSAPGNPTEAGGSPKRPRRP
jgi:hypothetical protein